MASTPATPKPPMLFEEIIQADTATYHIAYRAVTLVPASQVSTAKAYSSPVVTTMLVAIKDGRTTSKTIAIHAEDVYIYAGTTFNFKEKSVTLTANRIFCISVPSPAPVPDSLPKPAPDSVSVTVSPQDPNPPPTPVAPENMITIDISGRDSAIRRWPIALSGAPGINFALLWQQTQWSIGRPNDFVPPPAGIPWGSPGQLGADGIHGNHGLPGGQLTLKSEQLISLLPPAQPGPLVSSTAAATKPNPTSESTGAKCTLFIDNAGGKGSIGQQGGQGGSGGSLVIPDMATFKAPQNPPSDSATYVGAGGNGGRGGDAGNWGALGEAKVFIPTLPPPPESEKPQPGETPAASSKPSATDSGGLNIGTPKDMTPRVAKGGLAGLNGNRGTITGISEYGMSDGDPALGTWPPVNETSGVAGADAVEPNGRGTFVAIEAIEAAQVIDSAYLAMVVARLQAEWPVVSVKLPADPVVKNDLLNQRANFKTSVAWMAGEVELVKQSKRKFIKEEEKVIQGVEKAVGRLEKEMKSLSDK